MLLALQLKKSTLLPSLVCAVHFIAMLAAWANRAPSWLKAVLFVFICLSCLRTLKHTKRSNEITGLHFQEQALTICLKAKHWVPVDMCVRHCDRYFVVLDLHCLEHHFNDYVEHRWLCFYPSRIADVEQRNLRRFIRFHWNSQREKWP